MKSQKFLTWFYASGLFLFLLGTVLACFPRIIGGGSSIRLIGAGMALTGYLFLVAIAIISSRRTRKLMAERRAEHARIMEAALYAPDIAKYARPDSIVTTKWTTNYQTSVRLFATVTMASPAFALAAVVLGAFLSMVLAALTRTTNWAVIAGAFAVGVTLSYYQRYRRTARMIRPLYQSQTVTHNIALVIDPGGFREIIGSIEKPYRWSDVERIIAVRGNVAIIRDKAMRIIPHYAFRSREDSIAFTALAKALKNGLPPPPYDWSAYTTVEEAEPAVWPPPPTAA